MTGTPTGTGSVRMRRAAADVSDTYPVEQAEEAHRRLEAGGVRGRLVLAL